MSEDEIKDLIYSSNGLNDLVLKAMALEREACAKIAEVAGLGEPHSLPPYSVRALIAREIRSRGCYDWI